MTKASSRRTCSLLLGDRAQVGRSSAATLAVGAVLAGILGAVVAVPVVAVITRALPELRRREPGDLGPQDP